MALLTSAGNPAGILKAGGVSWQATKTWKAGNDPEFTAGWKNLKMRLSLLDCHEAR